MSQRVLDRLAHYEDLEEQELLRPVVRGEWLHEPGRIPRCSVCMEYSDDADTGSAICCPFCGALMECKKGE